MSEKLETPPYSALYGKIATLCRSELIQGQTIMLTPRQSKGLVLSYTISLREWAFDSWSLANSHHIRASLWRSCRVSLNGCVAHISVLYVREWLLLSVGRFCKAEETMPSLSNMISLLPCSFWSLCFIMKPGNPWWFWNWHSKQSPDLMYSVALQVFWLWYFLCRNNLYKTCLREIPADY